MAASLSPLMEMEDFPSAEKFLQKYYKELTPDEMAKITAKML